jgi:5-methylcytosine-specific restriction endonuclease McrA
MKKLNYINRKKLRSSIMANRRETIYKYISKKNNGNVPCFVCGKHVKEKNATLEHVIPLSNGGTDDIDNLSISHYQCNNARGSDVDFSWNIR